MEAAIYMAPRRWADRLPAGTADLRTAAALGGRNWDLLVLTPEGCRTQPEARCRLLLAPGDCPEALVRVRADAVVSYGLSLRDTLTLSSLADPLLCLQRAIPLPGGASIEPQEFPLPPLPEPPEGLLPLLGLWLILGRPGGHTAPFPTAFSLPDPTSE